MLNFTQKNISDMIESLANGARLVSELHETFGGDVLLVELNPLYPGKNRKMLLKKRNFLLKKLFLNKVIDSDLPQNLVYLGFFFTNKIFLYDHQKRKIEVIKTT